VTTDAWGIEDGWTDTAGQWQHANPDTVEAIRAAMGEPAGRAVHVVRPGQALALAGPGRLVLEDGTDLGAVDQVPPDVPPGIHQHLGATASWLLVSPGVCHVPAGLRTWGVTMQVPTTRSRASWGIGDLADVRAVATWITGLDGDAVALSPLHAPTPVAPIEPSPYRPSSRRWRNPMLLRVDELASSAPSEIATAGRRARARLAEPVVDRDATWRDQCAALESVWAALGPDVRGQVAAWSTAQGSDLERWARFCALAERHGASWRRWPAELRHPDSPAVERAADGLADRVAFHAWLQHAIHTQLDEARAAGARLVQDLAVGAHPDGADAWAWQDLLADGFSIGAPPDEFESDGQAWGVPPWIPWRLRDAGYLPLAGLLRAAMVAGGGLRIDHVMGLRRLFWVPAGGEPRDGAYVRFAGRELLELVALESSRAGALVIGEDLGTVEAGFREELAATGILSTRVVWFEDEPPERWPEHALGMVTTHDLPTLSGLVGGTDSPPAMRARLERLVGPVAGRSDEDVALDVHARLGAGATALVLATLEDLAGSTERPNRPGTTSDDRPNWSLALPVAVDDLPRHPRATAVLGALAGGRRRD
jgi:4-alpha-glucanotransferase